ncbi:MAG: endonuclease domain-containing protein [Sphingomonadales bacterium]|nr:endonuclease domain-containing protein [Sphingomonadales bacterium]
MKILPTCGEGDRAKRGGGGVQTRTPSQGGGNQPVRRPETYAARRLRRAMTLPEVLLWQELKANGEGLRFRRQHPIGPYVADFYCAAAGLVIEIDGAVHHMGNRPERDDTRTRILEQKGFTVVRLMASDVLNDVAAAAEAVVRAATPLRQSLRDCHLPVNGED